jgi:hypothetical protein
MSASSSEVLLEAEAADAPSVGAQIDYPKADVVTLATLSGLWGRPATSRAAEMSSASFDLAGGTVTAVAHLTTRRVIPAAPVYRLVIRREAAEQR